MDPNHRPLEQANAASRSLEQAQPPQVTTIRNLNSPHGRCCLGVGHRGLVPITSVPEIEGWSGSTSAKARRWPLSPVSAANGPHSEGREAEAGRGATALFRVRSCELKSNLGHSNACPPFRPGRGLAPPADRGQARSKGASAAIGRQPHSDRRGWRPCVNGSSARIKVCLGS